MKSLLTRASALLSILVMLAGPLASVTLAAGGDGHGHADKAHELERGADHDAHRRKAHEANQAAGHGAAHGTSAPEHGAAHGPSKIRPAPEDAHWWLGQEILPVALRQQVADMIGPSWKDGTPSTGLNVGHIFLGLLVFVLGIGMGLAAHRKVKGAILPPKKWGAAAFFDIVMEALMGLMESMMPREKALRFLPLVTGFAIFILISNLLGLVPGLIPPTQSLNTTLALGLIAFVYYNYQGVRTHGVAKYLAHFMGPVLFIAPLMLVIELISHAVRPASLALRLMGNMFGDHQVLFIFMGFGLPLIPIPLIGLGLLVCVVQTVVFTLLFVVYLSLAVEEHDHDDAHDHAHGATAGAH